MITRKFIHDGVSSIAEYSDCMRYRFNLQRTWSESEAGILFIMLNPSTATERQNDPTVERCERRARSMGYGAYRVCNIFGWRDTSPADLRQAEEPIGRGNDEAILESSEWADAIVCAWGNHGSHLNRGREVESLLRDAGKQLTHLGLTKIGQPQHPLYVSYARLPMPWPD
ncbi:MAG: DUF1643 domain-containing protein [Albidovulum sp.]|nr:DUF1643 domain-containing protein [Albidovulum sp.]